MWQWQRDDNVMTKIKVVSKNYSVYIMFEIKKKKKTAKIQDKKLSKEIFINFYILSYALSIIKIKINWSHIYTEKKQKTTFTYKK